MQDPAYLAARAHEVGRDCVRLLITVTCALLRGWIDLRLLGWSEVGARSDASNPCAPAWASRSLGSRVRPRKPPPFAEAVHLAILTHCDQYAILRAWMRSRATRFAGSSAWDALLPARPLPDDGQAGRAAVGLPRARASRGARNARGRARRVARRCREGAIRRARQDGGANRREDTEARRRNQR
jgi:hypothetical protein